MVKKKASFFTFAGGGDTYQVPEEIDLDKKEDIEKILDLIKQGKIHPAQVEHKQIHHQPEEMEYKQTQPSTEEMEWFPKDGQKPCVRGYSLPSTLIDKDKKKSVKLEQAYEILDLLKKKKDDSEYKIKQLSEKDIKKARKFSRRSRQMDKNNPGGINASRSDLEVMSPGCTATELRGGISQKYIPYKLLDGLLDYGLIETYRLQDNNITTHEKIEEIQRKILVESRKKKSNYSKIEELEDELWKNNGHGDYFFKITDDGLKSIDKIQNRKDDDPLAFFKDFLSSSQGSI